MIRPADAYLFRWNLADKPADAYLLWGENTVLWLISRADKFKRTGLGSKEYGYVKSDVAANAFIGKQYTRKKKGSASTSG